MEQLLFDNTKIVTKSDVFSELLLLELGNFAEISVILLKKILVESLIFCTVACLFVSYMYIKYLISGFLKDFPCENS